MEGGEVMARVYGIAAMLAILATHVLVSVTAPFDKVGYSASGWFFGGLFMVVYYSFVAARV